MKLIKTNVQTVRNTTVSYPSCWGNCEYSSPDGMIAIFSNRPGDVFQIVKGGTNGASHRAVLKSSPHQYYDTVRSQDPNLW